MSSRGCMFLGKKVLAETKQLIPTAWLAFLTVDNLPALEHGRNIEIDRKQAISNFDSNQPFFTELTKGTLDFSLADELVSPIRESRARKVTLQIGELLPQDNEFSTVDVLMNAIAERDSEKTYTLARSDNPFTGEPLDPWEFRSTVEMLYTVCWITPRWLEIASKDELASMVTGYVYT